MSQFSRRNTSLLVKKIVFGNSFATALERRTNSVIASVP
jgi:hypothetical protein